MKRFRLSNIPIPEGHVIALVAGIGFHTWLPLRLFEALQIQVVPGWFLILLGVVLAGWAVAAARNMDISKPARVVDTGPYRFSRNPMYVAWTLSYIGIAIVVNTWWLLIFLPALIAFTHYFVIRREEQQLEQHFGKAYRQYCNRVGRYW